MRAWQFSFAGNLRTSGLLTTKSFVSSVGATEEQAEKECLMKAGEVLKSPRRMGSPTTVRIPQKKR